jgi:uncharacterized protein YprB with RNaseH-like and TPR domain
MTAEKKKVGNDLEAQLAVRGYGPDRSERRISRDEIRRAVKGRKPRPHTAAVPSKPTEKIIYRRDIPRAQSPAPARKKRSGLPVILEESINGLEIRDPRGVVVTTRAGDLDQIEPVSIRFRELLDDETSGLCCQVQNVCETTPIGLDDIIFMDVESTGLGNSPLFLIGVMLWNGSSFEIQQFFARNYAEESAVISFFLDSCAERKLLVTFNGKSFDFPYIRARAATNGLRFTIDPYHLDMLHVCRRIWKRKLPNCKLQTLETFICNRRRYGDIPGSQIPDAYHEYVRSSDAWQMVDVLKHNLLDLLTMADLMNRFPELKVE